MPFNAGDGQTNHLPKLWALFLVWNSVFVLPETVLLCSREISDTKCEFGTKKEEYIYISLRSSKL